MSVSRRQPRGMVVRLRTVAWPTATRIIASRFPPVDLFERLSGDPCDWGIAVFRRQLWRLLRRPRIRDRTARDGLPLRTVLCRRRHGPHSLRADAGAGRVDPYGLPRHREPGRRTARPRHGPGRLHGGSGACGGSERRRIERLGLPQRPKSRRRVHRRLLAQGGRYPSANQASRISLERCPHR
jgi:hypothetical protein